MTHSRWSVLVIPAIVLAAIGRGVGADIIRVPEDFEMIQPAIDAAQDGDEIIVSPGLYRETLDFLDKLILVRSLDPLDPEVVSTTLIQGNGGGGPRTVALSRGELSGFTVILGNGGVHASGAAVLSYSVITSNAVIGDSGGGVRAEGNAEVHDNTIEGNVALSVSTGGGGVYATGAAVIRDNLIRGNTANDSNGAGSGGGVFATGGAVIQDNLIEDNVAQGNGGGLFVTATARVDGNTIRENRGGAGGGVFSAGGVVSNNTIVQNITFASGAGVWASGIARIESNAIRLNTADDTGGGVVAEGSAVVIGNEITRNTAEDGAGIYARDAARVQSNLISVNTADRWGGGIFLLESAVASDNDVTDNTAEEGGGLYAREGQIVGNRLMGNTADRRGSGLHIQQNGVVADNLVFENHGDYGVYVVDDTSNPLLMRHNTVVQNDRGVLIETGLDSEFSNNVIAFNNGGPELTIENNFRLEVNYNCIFNPNGSLFGGVAGESINAGVGNLLVDPRFQLDEIHVLPNSPCVDAGDPDFIPLPDETDFDGDPRVSRGRVDIGGDEVPLPDTETTLTGLDIVTGERIEGGLPDLEASDDQYVRTRSGSGSRISEAHLLEMIVSARTNAPTARLLDITIEARLDDPRGLARIALRNWNTGGFEHVGQYSIGLNEETIVFSDIDATDYIRPSGGIEVSIKHIVSAPFLSFTFESWIDRVEIIVR